MLEIKEYLAGLLHKKRYYEAEDKYQVKYLKDLSESFVETYYNVVEGSMDMYSFRTIIEHIDKNIINEDRVERIKKTIIRLFDDEHSAEKYDIFFRELFELFAASLFIDRGA